MIDRNSFLSIPNCLDAEVQKMPFIVTSHGPTCLTYGETGQLSSSGTDIKAAGVLYRADPNAPVVKYVFSVLPGLGMSSMKKGVVKSSFGSFLSFPFLAKTLPAACVVAGK